MQVNVVCMAIWKVVVREAVWETFVEEIQVAVGGIVAPHLLYSTRKIRYYQTQAVIVLQSNMDS